VCCDVVGLGGECAVIVEVIELGYDLD